MRLAALILGLVLTAVVGIQSLAILTTPFVPTVYANAASGGVMMAIALAVGAGFALTTPKVSIFAFGIAAAIGGITGASTPYTDLRVWAFVAAALAVLSFFASRTRRQDQNATPVIAKTAQPKAEGPVNEPVPAQPSLQAGENDIIAQLERLGRLHASKALSDEEFAVLKSQLLSQKAN